MKGLMIINNKVEDGEALFTRALLLRAGYLIDTATLESSLNIITAYNLPIKVDLNISEVRVDNYDFILLPGGPHVFDWQNKSEKLTSIINQFNDNNKLIAAICAAPLFLKDTKILNNKNFTIFPGLEKHIINAKYHNNVKVITDQNVITARSAGVIYDFVFEVLKYFKDLEKIEKLKASIVY